MPDFLHRLSVHKLALYYLQALWLLALVFCFTRTLPYQPMDLVFSTCLILAACWIGNALFARAWGVRANPDSMLITALILALIITPAQPSDYKSSGYVVFASLWAMASKYLLTTGKRPLFNPAAFGVALAAIVLGNSVSWWIGGGLFFLPVILIGGALVIVKMRNHDMLIPFAAAALLTMALTSPMKDPWQPLLQFALHSMFLFFAFVMLTEPRTAPNGKLNRIVYGAMVGVLFAPAVHIGKFYSTPELALLAGNLFAGATHLWKRRAAQKARTLLAPGP